MRTVIKILLFGLSTYTLSGQVEFSKIPQYLQLFARDSNNNGHFEVQGYSPFPGTIRTVVSEMTGSVVIQTLSKPVKSYETFTLQHTIPACLKNYQLEVFLKENGKAEHREKLVLGLVAGDFFIVDGQSNAECPSHESTYRHDSSYYNPFTRVIGSSFAVATALSQDATYPIQSVGRDCEFKRPSSDSYIHGDYGFSGIWPLTLQSELANETGIPNCFINGSQGSTLIRQHFASHTPSVEDSLVHSTGAYNKPKAFIYDRIYKKLSANDAVKGVKGIFWYQGESDGNTERDSSLNYGKNFETLYTSWKADYPSLKKIVVLQLNLGCGGEYHNLVREIQRKLPQRYHDVAVMSTVGSPFSDRDADGCHYTIAGYTRLAKKLLPLAKKYMYNFPLDEEIILPANIQRAYYSSANEICIEFNKNIQLQDSCIYPSPQAGIAYMKDYFFKTLSEKIHINSLRVEANKIFLNLNLKETEVKNISYLPPIFSNIPSVYSGPWILTEANPELGAFAFTEFPVEQREEQASVFVFPNPAKTEVALKFQEEEFNTIWLYDSYGKLLTTANIAQRNSFLNVETLSSGIYILRVKSATGNFCSVKIVIE
ncbi:hypothetical protein CNR22_11965 [Sphingobacteriaceae bacterium]|nr:hypothetical protein CNR22_11965 [Sphingobacteriaceae bacterium]